MEKIPVAASGDRMPEISAEKKELLELEKSGLYVFHGSYADVETLKPR